MCRAVKAAPARDRVVFVHRRHGLGGLRRVGPPSTDAVVAHGETLLVGVALDGATFTGAGLYDSYKRTPSNPGS